MTQVDEYAEDILAPRISTVSGVAQVNVQGAAKYAVRVQVDPERLQAQRLGLNEVSTALQNWNVTQPTGQLFGPLSTYTIAAKGQLNNAAEFAQIVVAYRNGRPVRLNQVANVIDSVQVVTQRAWYITKDAQRRSITLDVLKQPGTNVIEVADAVRAVLPGLQAQLPPSVHIVIRQDRSVNIRAAFARHPDDAVRHAHPGGRRHLSLPAQHLGDGHPGAGAPVLDPGQLRRHEDAALQPRQPVDDGGHPLGRVRRRRRDCDARERRAPHGGAASRRCRPRCRAPRRLPSRS